MHSLAPLSTLFHEYRVPPVDRTRAAAYQALIDGKTKPVGSLGRLESLALQLALIQDSPRPQLRAPHLLVCAGDHGAAADPQAAGISAYPQDVTWQMVENFLAGGAAINALTRAAGMTLRVADAGVAHDFGARAGLIDAKVGAGGTASYMAGAAMSAEQCAQAMANGGAVVGRLADAGCNVLGFGEMGIGNTASASLLTHCLLGLPLAEVVGRGTGLDDAGVARKCALLERALQAWPERPPLNRFAPPQGGSGNGIAAEDAGEALGILARFGGFEIAMLAGAMLAAAQRRMVLLIDGFIVTAALLVAWRLAPAVLDYCVFAHCSDETGHRRQHAALGARPLLDLGLRLGEGTGAALAYPLLLAATAFLGEMASFDEAGVSGKQ